MSDRPKSRTPEEKETIIRFDETQAHAFVYTHNRRMTRKLERLGFKREGLYWRVPKKLVSIRAPRVGSPGFGRRKVASKGV